MMRSQSGEYSMEQKGIIFKILVALEANYGAEVFALSFYNNT